jgi:ferrous iron transport protein B
LCFGLLEDSGYLPRLGVLVHRSLARVGLGGQAAIPLILGLGCVTTATMATRALPTRRERLIAVLLLSLATPCAAQLGVVLAILSFSPWALVAWAGVVLLTFLVTGVVAGRGLPGPPPRLLAELPPLRWPSPWHLVRKSAMRIGRYLLEVMPYFAAASVILWGLESTGLLDGVEAGLRPLARLVGLPEEASRFLLFGFFRRDYGAAGLYDFAHAGALGDRQLIVAAVLLTLFIPCIAQLMVLRKEFGWRVMAAIVGFVFVTAFAVAGVLNLGLAAAGL